MADRLDLNEIKRRPLFEDVPRLITEVEEERNLCAQFRRRAEVAEEGYEALVEAGKQDDIDHKQEVERLRVEQLRDAIRFHSHIYYNMDSNIISDATFDTMYRLLQSIEKENPHLVTPDSPTQLVGTDISGPLRDRRK